MAVDQIVSSSTDVVTVLTNAGRGITLSPTFQRGFVPNMIDGFRFTLNVPGGDPDAEKISRYRLVPTKVQATADKPPTVIELKGAFDDVCSPAELESFQGLAGAERATGVVLARLHRLDRSKPIDRRPGVRLDPVRDRTAG